MQGWEYTMRVSMIEIYNEEYRDLLSRKPRAAQAKIEVQHDDIEKETILVSKPGRSDRLRYAARESVAGEPKAKGKSSPW